MELLKRDTYAIQKALPNYLSAKIYLVESDTSLLEMLNTAASGTAVKLTRNQALDLGIIITVLEARYCDYDEVDDVDRNKYDYFRRLDSEGIDAAMAWENHEYPGNRDMDFYIGIDTARYNFALLLGDLCGDYTIANGDYSHFNEVSARQRNPACEILDAFKSAAENIGPLGIPNMLDVDPVVFETIRYYVAGFSPWYGTFPRVSSDVIKDPADKIKIDGLDMDESRYTQFIENLPLNRNKWKSYMSETGVDLSPHDMDILAQKIASAWAKFPQKCRRITRLGCKLLGISDEMAHEFVQSGNRLTN